MLLFVAVSLNGVENNVIQKTDKLKLHKIPLNISLLDLTVHINRSPKTVVAGTDLKYIYVTVKNVGQATKIAGKCYTTFLILSTDTNIPVARPLFNKPFGEDIAIGAGIGICPKLGPGESEHIDNFGSAQQNISMRIPKDTPPGDYYLGVVVDGDKVFAESNENNNTHYVPIEVLSTLNQISEVIAQKKPDLRSPAPLYLPDIKPISLYFDKFCNLKAEIKNTGKGKINTNVQYKLFMNGKQIYSGGSNLNLSPGETTKIEVCSKAILGTWVSEKNNWKLIVNSDNEIIEEKNGNNEIIMNLICLQRYLKKPVLKR